SVGIYDSFVAEAAVVGLEIVTAQAFTDQSNTDFSVQLQAVKGSGADLLFLPIYAQEAAYILTQAAAIDLDVIFFGVDGMDGILEKIGEDNIALTEGVMLLTPFAADSQDEKVVNFVTKYKAAYNMTPDQFAADGYDAIYIIKAAIEQAGITEIGDGFNEALVAAMTQITVEGVTGSMQWTADGEPAKNATAVVIKDGVYVAFE
ncbi:MAG: ABC transporter substrate-binding protein, partial [Eubacteriaceae bacterium]|nr:ABC transporter substrate-binding protein [Eubacteriaceae bacterium]